MGRNARNRVYLRVRQVSDLETGEICLGLVPRSDVDQVLLAARHLQHNDDVRAEISKPRNLRQWRRIHRLGQLVQAQVPGFESLGSHDCIKRLQADSGLHCDEERLDLQGWGVLIRRVPRTLAFDEMEEGDFSAFYRGLSAYLADTYWPRLSPDDVAAMAELMPSEPYA